ncbi:MAG: hypothetical protein IKF77_01820 [Thermoguttaceae bacterium]|nr:hypothetical protein [Thermoguttaceae bacterium]
MAESLSNERGLRVVARDEHGMRCLLDGQRPVFFFEGTPEQMGAAHGRLFRDGIDTFCRKVQMVGLIHTIGKKVSYDDKIADLKRRSFKYVPDRFFREMNAIADVTGQPRELIYQINFLHELFHCSGVAACGKATVDGNVRLGRILDYMRDLGIYAYAGLFVLIPTETLDGRPLNKWISVSYAGSVGSVTCMNEKGLAIGEKGGGGERKWDGLPMSFLMRRMMEECSTVEEAIALMKSVPLTCDYYYTLSDAGNNIAGVVAKSQSEQPVYGIRPNEDYPDWMPNGASRPKKFEDVVYLSGPGERIETLAERIDAAYGKIDAQTVIEMMKRPVCKTTNLHNAVFESVTRDFYFADAGRKVLAADAPYYKGNINEFLEFYQKNK